MPGEEGPIKLDSVRGKALGFTSDRFDGYLWQKDGEIIISVIESKQPGQGHLSQLFAAIEAAGYRVAVPTPFPHMKAILEHKGFQRTCEQDELFGCVEVWRKPCATARTTGTSQWRPCRRASG